MSNTDYNKQRHEKFNKAAAEIHKGFAKNLDNISPHGCVISDAFRSEVFRKEQCNKGDIEYRMGKSIPHCVVEEMVSMSDKLVYKNDFVQVIKVRSWSNNKETVHGWIVTVCRDHNAHNIDYGQHLAKGQIIYSQNRAQSYQLMNLVHDTFCY